jgi:F-type H+-transporting ATPase subunit b
MQIDGFTVIAQIINFLVLVWLLKRFLYGPVTQAMAARQQKIAAALNEARHQAEQAEVEAQTYQTRRATLEAQREAWLEQARQEVATRRTEGLEQARREVAAQREEWLAAWQREWSENQPTLRREAARRLAEAVRRALRDLADADLEQRMLTSLWAKLRTLEAGERAMLAQAALGGCAVRTAFPLNAELQQQSQTALCECLGAEIPLIFHHDPNAVCGVILEMPGHRLAWTLDGYLDGFGEALTRVVNAPLSETGDDQSH